VVTIASVIPEYLQISIHNFAVRYGTMLYDAVRCGAVGMVRYGVVQYSALRCFTVWYRAVRGSTKQGPLNRIRKNSPRYDQ
jgi:hypothetical protein